LEKITKRIARTLETDYLVDERRLPFSQGNQKKENDTLANRGERIQFKQVFRGKRDKKEGRRIKKDK
jgi:hypothetical protein